MAIKKVLALTVDGQLTFCSATPENRGKGRCNHVGHQEDGQTPAEFLESVKNCVKVEEAADETLTILEQMDKTLLDPRSTTKRLGLRTDLDKEIQDQSESIEHLVSKYANVENPKWSKLVEDIGINGVFDIGVPGEEGYRAAKLLDVEEIEQDHFDGKAIEIKAKYEFEGEVYELSFGEVPAVNPDGTIIINSTPFRVLPILEQYKAGLRSFGNSVSVQQADGNLGFNLKYDSEFINDKGEKDWMISSYGQEIPLSYARDYIFGKNDGSELKPGPRYGLKNLDEAFFQRFPEFENNYEAIIGLPMEEPNDLEWRRVIRYQDIVADLYKQQAKRMGTTFRSNLVKRDKAIAANPDITKEELDEKFPLFYQQNLTDNIKRELSTRSNVQFAENLNAFAALSQAQKISLTGKGSWNKEKVPRALRLPHKSHEGLIDSLDVSSGGNVGLTISLNGGYIGEDRFIHKKTPEMTNTSLRDFIPYRLNNNTDRGTLSVAHLKQSVPIVGGEDPLQNTEAWADMKGTKLGCNLRVAYIPSDGVYEDAVVISESTAAKMKTIENRKIYLRDGQHKRYQVGQKLYRKDKIGGTEIKADSEITNISDDGVVTIKTEYKMGVGDKISGFHGNKGTVSKIIPDAEMPKIVNEQGLAEPAQILMSPSGVGGRRNIGQVLEANANIDGKPNIDSKRTVLLPDGHKIKSTAGVAYVHRLNHIAQKSLSSHLDDLGADGESKGARATGSMESILLSANPDRIKVLDYLRHQEQSHVHEKLDVLMKAVGVEIKGEGINLEGNGKYDNKI